MLGWWRYRLFLCDWQPDEGWHRGHVGPWARGAGARTGRSSCTDVGPFQAKRTRCYVYTSNAQGFVGYRPCVPSPIISARSPAVAPPPRRYTGDTHGHHTAPVSSLCLPRDRRRAVMRCRARRPRQRQAWGTCGTCSCVPPPTPPRSVSTTSLTLPVCK
jgi:hypothetical protein